MSPRSRRRRGRKRDPEASRNDTAAWRHRQRVDNGPTQELKTKRLAIAGDERVGLEFPLDVLLARRRIDQDMRDVGLRFAALSWAVFGFPHPGCEAIYQRLVACAPADMPAPRSNDADSGQRKAFESMERLLGRSQEVRRAVANAAQFLRLPQALVDEADGRPSRVEAFSEMAALVEGLRRLVVGTRHARPQSPASEPAAIGTMQERHKRRRLAAWFEGPLILLSKDET